MSRRFSEIRGRPLTRFEAGAEAVAATKPGSWFFLHVANPLDKRLLPVTKGRWSVTGPGQHVGLLTTTGAKSGQSRTTPLVYAPDGPRLILIASAGGSPKDPSWAYNLRRHPACSFLAGGVERRYTARQAEGDERTQAWTRAVDWYHGYNLYQARITRPIPVFILEPALVTGPSG
jgi:deazaflavin-dependent oxidoreductase (nitroreductase family)